MKLHVPRPIQKILKMIENNKLLFIIIIGLYYLYQTISEYKLYKEFFVVNNASKTSTESPVSVNYVRIGKVEGQTERWIKILSAHNPKSTFSFRLDIYPSNETQIQGNVSNIVHQSFIGGVNNGNTQNAKLYRVDHTASNNVYYDKAAINKTGNKVNIWLHSSDSYANIGNVPARLIVNQSDDSRIDYWALGDNPSVSSVPSNKTSVLVDPGESAMNTVNKVSSKVEKIKNQLSHVKTAFERLEDHNHDNRYARNYHVH